MEALSFQRLQRVITSISAEHRHDTGAKGPEEDEEDDSFFELELSVPDADSKSYTTVTFSATRSKDDPKSSPAHLSSEKTQNDPKYNFSQSKRKILPIDSSFLRPQSPISLLKSAPKFRVFMFRKSTKSAAEAEKTEGTQLRNRRRNFFTKRFKQKEAEFEPAFTRDSCPRKNGIASCSDSSPLHGWSTSKRFSKELIQKYLRIVKPLRVKFSKRRAGGVGYSGEFSPASVGSANREQNAKAPAGFRVVVCRHLGKSKSASASVTSPARRDDSLLQQHDGIESAILHCKRSFSSSRDFSPLSPSASIREVSQLLDSERS
ncbi:hypothetical protein SAY87_001474 [Trapa incisa]|uniref:Membrane-associated kinase regulator 5 n=1 Tax=Trapa incisa TaxID=236973 RepID=A0AAN7GG68_9MYRT|nr:hypothetical protein SAY87_001474 [Trapa incisa]